MRTMATSTVDLSCKQSEPNHGGRSKLLRSSYKLSSAAARRRRHLLRTVFELSVRVRRRQSSLFSPVVVVVRRRRSALVRSLWANAKNKKLSKILWPIPMRQHLQ